MIHVPHIDIFKIGETKPFIGIKPIKKSRVDIGEFFSAIIDLDNVTPVGSNGLIQLSFEVGVGAQKAGCSGHVPTNICNDNFREGHNPIFLESHR